VHLRSKTPKKGPYVFFAGSLARGLHTAFVDSLAHSPRRELETAIPSNNVPPRCIPNRFPRLPNKLGHVALCAARALTQIALSSRSHERNGRTDLRP
jgi:hypothetical protein